MLEKVKSNLGITGTYQDNIIQNYIQEVQNFLIDGGVSKKLVQDEKLASLISEGVDNLWIHSEGKTTLSPYFIQRAIQLVYKNNDKDDTNELQS